MRRIAHGRNFGQHSEPTDLIRDLDGPDEVEYL